MTKRLTDEEIEELGRLEGWPRPWRLDAGSEGDESDVVAYNSAYPDEISHLAEFTDERDARLAVLAVNALPSLLEEVRASRAAPSVPREVEEALRAMLDAHCRMRDDSPRGCSCFYAIEHAAVRAALRLLGGADGTPSRDKDLRAAAQALVEAYADCRERGSFSGFWTHVDDVSQALDLRPCPVCEGGADVKEGT